MVNLTQEYGEDTCGIVSYADDLTLRRKQQSTGATVDLSLAVNSIDVFRSEPTVSVKSIELLKYVVPTVTVCPSESPLPSLPPTAALSPNPAQVSSNLHPSVPPLSLPINHVNNNHDDQPAVFMNCDEIISEGMIKKVLTHRRGGYAKQFEDTYKQGVFTFAKSKDARRRLKPAFYSQNSSTFLRRGMGGVVLRKITKGFKKYSDVCRTTLACLSSEAIQTRIRRGGVVLFVGDHPAQEYLRNILYLSKPYGFEYLGKLLRRHGDDHDKIRCQHVPDIELGYMATRLIPYLDPLHESLNIIKDIGLMGYRKIFLEPLHMRYFKTALSDTPDLPMVRLLVEVLFRGWSLEREESLPLFVGQNGTDTFAGNTYVRFFEEVLPLALLGYENFRMNNWDAYRDTLYHLLVQAIATQRRNYTLDYCLKLEWISHIETNFPNVYQYYINHITAFDGNKAETLNSYLRKMLWEKNDFDHAKSVIYFNVSEGWKSKDADSADQAYQEKHTDRCPRTQKLDDMVTCARKLILDIRNSLLASNCVSKRFYPIVNKDKKKQKGILAGGFIMGFSQITIQASLFRFCSRIMSDHFAMLTLYLASATRIWLLTVVKSLRSDASIHVAFKHMMLK